MNTKQLVQDLLAVKDKAQVDLSEAEEDLDYIITELNLATSDSKPELENYLTGDIISELQDRFKDRKDLLDLLWEFQRLV